MSLPSAVVWPPAGRTSGVLSVARPLPSGWERGVEFASNGCLAPVRQGPCDVDPDPKTTDRAGVARFEPFWHTLGVECSTLSNNLDDLEDVAGEELDSTRSNSVAQELSSGALTGNPSLADATVITVPALSIDDALRCLELAFGDATSGRQGFVHAHPYQATRLFELDQIWRDVNRWRTVAGNTVSVDFGYPPDGLWITLPVHAASSPRDLLSDVDRSVNTSTAVAESLELVAFDPCAIYTVTLPEPECEIPVS